MSHLACGRSALINLDMLIEKLGGDHGGTHHHLVGKFACSVPCRWSRRKAGVLHLRPEPRARDPGAECSMEVAAIRLAGVIVNADRVPEQNS